MLGPHRLSAAADLDCDVLIVGGGAGGSCVAAVLTASGLDVVMVEEGPARDRHTVPDSIPEGLHDLWRGGGLTTAFGPTPVAYAEGRCVGGGTEINSGIFQIAPEALLQQWAENYQIEQFGAATLEPYFARAADIVHASLTAPPLGEASEILRRGGEAKGWKVEALKRATKDCVGTNLCSIGCPTGGKQSMTATLIPQALQQGLRLIAECRIAKLHLDDARVAKATGSAMGADGQRHKVTIRPRQVFLCAGAIHTPALLLRSGIKKNIGQTLRLHPTLRMAAVFDQVVDAHLSRLPLYAITEFMPERRLGGSVFSPGLFAMNLAENWALRSELLPLWRQCGVYYAMARGQGRGRITPLPGITEPLVRCRLDLSDWYQLGQGISELAEALFATGAKRLHPAIRGHKGWTHPNEVREFLETGLPQKRASLMTIHLFGSCPPGENEQVSATDSFGRVHEVTNLTLADASQIPEAPGVNPQGTVMALALRAAEAFLADFNRRQSS